jgi:transcription-repair coupling factor (superfamily II helicase)
VKPATVKTFVEMLHVRFAAPEGGSAAAGLNRLPVDPGMVMKLVSRNAKRGAQFTPQGILRWPLSSARAEDVLAETQELLAAIRPERPVFA